MIEGIGSFLGWVAYNVAQAFNAAIQVLADFIMLIADIVPNPDPFREVVTNMGNEQLADVGFYVYWIDCFVGINRAAELLDMFFLLWTVSLVFAVIYRVGMMIKP